MKPLKTQNNIAPASQREIKPLSPQEIQAKTQFPATSDLTPQGLNRLIEEDFDHNPVPPEMVGVIRVRLIDAGEAPALSYPYDNFDDNIE
jgi:hypothetical protein